MRCLLFRPQAVGHLDRKRVRLTCYEVQQRASLASCRTIKRGTRLWTETGYTHNVTTSDNAFLMQGVTALQITSGAFVVHCSVETLLLMRVVHVLGTRMIVP